MNAQIQYDSLRELMVRQRRLESELAEVRLEIEAAIGAKLLLSAGAQKGLPMRAGILVPKRLERRLGRTVS